MADQEEPGRRRVALKFINLDMDTRQVVPNFDPERQALAMMDHPKITKVLEAACGHPNVPGLRSISRKIAGPL